MAGHAWTRDPEEGRWVCGRCGASVDGYREGGAEEPWPAWAEPEDDCDQGVVHSVLDS